MPFTTTTGAGVGGGVGAVGSTGGTGIPRACWTPSGVAVTGTETLSIAVRKRGKAAALIWKEVLGREKRMAQGKRDTHLISILEKRRNERKA